MKTNPKQCLTKNKVSNTEFGYAQSGGGHGTRTHGAVTPYLISNQAP